DEYGTGSRWRRQPTRDTDALAAVIDTYAMIGTLLVRASNHLMGAKKHAWLLRTLKPLIDRHREDADRLHMLLQSAERGFDPEVRKAAIAAHGRSTTFEVEAKPKQSKRRRKQ